MFVCLRLTVNSKRERKTYIRERRERKEKLKFKGTYKSIEKRNSVNKLKNNIDKMRKRYKKIEPERRERKRKRKRKREREREREKQRERTRKKERKKENQTRRERELR